MGKIKFIPDLKPSFAEARIKSKQAKKELKQKEAQAHNNFYRLVWQKNPHRCFECGEPLPVYDKALVHHLIEKNQQEDYSISLDTLENGVLLDLIHHDQCRLDLDKVPKVKKRTEELLAKYEPFLIKNQSK